MSNITLASVFEKAVQAPKHLQREVALAGFAVLDGGTEPLLVHQAKAARMLDCSRFTLRRLEKDKKISPVFIRGLKRYRLTEIRAIAEGGAE